MTGGGRKRAAVAVAWLAVVLALGWQQVQLWQHAKFDSDVTALLPLQADPQLEEATRRLIDAAATQWVVLVGAPDFEASKRAAMVALDVLDPDRRNLLSATSGGTLSEGLMAELARARGGLLTRADREWLHKASQQDIGRRAVQNLLQPFGDGFSSWRDDPLGLWADWLRERATSTVVRPRDGWLWIEAQGMEWIALPFDQGGSAFSAWRSGAHTTLLAQARGRVAALGEDTRVLAAGVVLQAEAAARQARREISLIGTGSLLAVVLLTFITFGSLRPILLVTLSLVVGSAAALSVTQWVFGQVHLLTLVFGASLVGVAEDYGIHYFAARQGQPVAQRWEQLRRISPGLWLALATSGIAYLALGLAPFPGLRQIAVFSVVGLAAAFLTVLCWFPWLDTRQLHITVFAGGFMRSLDAWPRWPRGMRGVMLAVAGALLLGTGVARLTTRDDVRLLQNVPAGLLAEQLEAGRILGMTSPAQVYLVSGDDDQQMLANGEALAGRLARLVKDGAIAGYQALSDWVPPAQMQRDDAETVARANQVAWHAVAEVTGEKPRVEAVEPTPLTLQSMRGTGSVPPGITAWQGEGGRHFSLVMLQGVDREALAPLAAVADGLPGVRFIDNTARYSVLLAKYRVRLSWLLALGLAAVIAVLGWRYGARAWRAWLPTVIGGLITVAIFGWVGIPLQLFVVLALMLLLGMGIDYGIFMQEHPGERSVWLAVAIAGISTLLSFGLLALSTTPALRAFGLAMLIGETAIWFLTPVFGSESARE